MEYGYTSKLSCRISNITYKQLHYWDKTNLVKPSITAADGTGSKRVYSFADLVCLRVTAKLKAEGISLEKIRKSIAYLSKNFPDYHNKTLINFVFLTDGDSIFVITENPDELLGTLNDGQFIFSVAIGQVINETKEKILSIEQEEMDRGHVFEVVIEPDRDVFLAYCPSLPGCVTWGHSEVEAYHYIQDAVKLHLEDMIADGDPIPGFGIVKSINPVIKLRDIEKKKVAS